MRYIIIGAGAVGGTIGGRLLESGNDVVLVARGAHLTALRERGLRLVTPDSDRTLPAHAVAGPGELGLRPGDVLVLAVKSQDTAALLAEWADRPVEGGGTAAERLPVVCAQNGVANEAAALRLFDRVYGMCVWLPATHLEPGTVLNHTAPLSGILTLGHYPHAGPGPELRAVAADLEAARFHAPVVPDVMRWKYGKLLGNLLNSLQAVAGDEATGEAGDIVSAVRDEGEAVLRAAGIPFVSEDERRSVQRDRMDLVPIPGHPRSGGSTWQSLARASGSTEADWLNGEIALLGRLHGVPTPVNSLLQRLANRFARDRRAPGSLPPADLRELLAATTD
jgi:2-dehydropantoate 2-reductase